MKKYKVKCKLVDLEPDNYHLTIKGKVAGSPVNLVVDTGASQTCFDFQIVNILGEHDTLIEEYEGLKVGIGGSAIDSKFTSIPLFQIGRLKIKNFPVVLLDLTHVNEAYNSMKLPHIDGILGSDFFVAYNAIIDYENRELWFSIKK
ncbi:MAG TPA: retropepsin-like aspartic protease [Bacteroidales bacterium]|jgi:hypothetical protein|nr:clan AA aspartic protease [Bacteroidales bacterium]HOF46346.1 retropepsin-like aspartic protease [Bacteroidales bacterium]HOS58018.1 retropepsin-like aspartic protease [Bacteroidales bacterium]HRR04948.1 retropepsin-like aspartic protease [Bacteroidales bacterium]HRT13471.1 retropepsin-like aspartic protease [Bacteroidales bacterium]